MNKYGRWLSAIFFLYASGMGQAFSDRGAGSGSDRLPPDSSSLYSGALVGQLVTEQALPEVVVSDQVSLFYARLDTGIAFVKGSAIVNSTQMGSAFLPKQSFIEVGLGYRVNDLWRVDTEVGYGAAIKRLPKAGEKAADMEKVGVHASLFSWTLNTYFDLFTLCNITPYVGAGLGVVSEKFSFERDDHSWRGQWNMYAGLGVHIGSKTALDIGYQYQDEIPSIVGQRLTIFEPSHKLRAGLRVFLP
ncbi:outer membrane beta-barrel protein [Bartonella sp. DGB2]|uniref:outer membrane beta-barrel protein n=1 Tax=Bartonella sp. DGB2 TaxID=3388426 RepID=UPI00398FB61A